MPFANEHRARQSSPDQFDDFRRTKPSGFPAGVEAVEGIKKDGGSETQSIVFDAAQWDVARSKQWLTDHDLSSAEFEEASDKEFDSMVRLDTLDHEGVAIRSVRRWDVLPLEKTEKTSDGFVRGQGLITRSGVFAYTNRRDGSVVRELRPPGEVFDEDSLRTFSLVPLTLDHPPDNLNPDTVASHQVGSVGHPVRVGSHARSDMLITHKDAIDAVLGGKNNLSCGYSCKVIDRGGTFTDSDGVDHKFDAIQTSIIGNHVAICDNPRAGPSAHMRIDDADAFADLSKQPRGDAKMFEEITINGKTYKVPKAVADQMRADGVLNAPTPTPVPVPVPNPNADAHARALQETQTRADKAEGELAALKAKTAEDEKKRIETQAKSDSKEATKKRVALCAVAIPVLDKKLDELLDMDDGEIMKAVIAKQAPDVSIEGKSDAYIEAVFDTIATTRVDTSKAITELVNTGKQTAANSGGDDSQKRADDARTRMEQRGRDAWKPEIVRKLEAKSAN